MSSISTSIPLTIPHRAPQDVATWYVAGTVLVLLMLIVLYVVLPWLGALPLLGPKYGLLLGVSIYFGVHVLLNSSMALLYAPLFIVLATALLPQTFPQANQSSPPEYFCWAAGLALITLALVLRLPWRELLWGRRRRILPYAFLSFFLVCIASFLQGLRLGVDFSYALRQFFGAALFCTYFCAATVVPLSENDVTKYFRVLKWFGMAASIYVVARYADFSGDIDSFKWGLSIYCAMLAVYCMAEVAVATKLRTRLVFLLQALILIANPMAFAARAATGIAALSSFLAFSMLSKSPKRKALLVAFVLLIAMIVIVGDLLGPLIPVLPHFARMDKLVPADILQDPSFVGRANQMAAAFEDARLHPFFGGGLGSSIVSFDPNFGGVKDVAAVDQGFAYLVSKFGLLGFFVFYWFVYSVFRQSGWPGRDLGHIALFSLFAFCVLFMLSHPVILQFIGAGFSGVIGGLLYRTGSPEGLGRSSARVFEGIG